MADNTLGKLLQIISSDATKELRLAALQVLGAVATGTDRRVVKTLLDRLADADQELRIAAIDALGQLHAEEALSHLEPFVREGGAELEAAVHAASQMGARGAKLMGKITQELSPAIRSRIAGVLAKSSTGNALVVTAQGLPDGDAKVIDATARSLAAEVPSYTAQQRSALAKFLIESLSAKKITPKAEAAMVRVLSALHEAKAEDIFWSRILPPHTPDVRAAALQGLGHDAVPSTPKRLQALLTCAGEKDFQIVAAALMILKQVRVDAKNAKPWITLLEAPDVATRRFAVERLQGIENAAVAQAMVAQLRHPDRALREATLKALLSFATGRAAILGELLESSDVDRVWFLARALADSKELTAAQRTQLFAKASQYHDTEDRRAAPLFFLLREANHAWLRDQLEAKALEFRKKKKYDEAISYYRLLAQDPACSEETRFELAATGLKVSTHDRSTDTRNNDPSLHQFSRLLQNPAFDLIGHVDKAKWLAIEDLFYLGFHFAEQNHRAKEFGKQALEMVVKRAVKTELGKQAKRKLKSEGLG